ncbi:hypothetical protein ABTB71_19085, partial [Acinetobacter baumannii]
LRTDEFKALLDVCQGGLFVWQEKYYKKHTHIDLYTQNNMGMFFGVESLRNHRIKNFFRIP